MKQPFHLKNVSRFLYTFLFVIFYFCAIAQTICTFQDNKLMVQELLIGNKITWTTTAEHDCQVFKIEKSSEGKSFFEIGSIPATGNQGLNQPQTYTFLDARIGFAHCFYRLTIYGKGGQTTESEIIDFQRVSPNDMLITATSGITSENAFSVTVQSATEGALDYTLSCSENGAAQNGTFRLRRGLNLFNFDLESLPLGLYEVRLMHAEEIEIVQVKKVKKSEISTLHPMVEKK
ncbi:MAG: hypothetical protein RL329_742 [Bacteroidota bacterium]|jgi:hypothetical protein